MLSAALRAGLLLVALSLLGCGSSSSSEISTIRFDSSGVGRDGVTLASSECGYGTIWLPLEWTAVPEATEELLLYIGQFRREAADGSERIVVPYASVITGIGPVRRSITTNTIPKEGESGSFEPFSSCPSEKKGQNFLFRLIALDSRGQVSSGDLSEKAVTQLTEEALGIEPPRATSAWADRVADATLASGQFTVKYGP